MVRYRCYPPTCCDCEWPLSKRILGKYLSEDEIAALKAQVEEEKTPLSKRWCCPNESCQKWIRPNELRVSGSRLSHSRTYSCPHCEALICSRCRERNHEEKCPPTNDDLHKVLSLAEKNGWMRCRRCGLVVEKTEGCDAVKCRSGHKFCYGCGGKPHHRQICRRRGYGRVSLPKWRRTGLRKQLGLWCAL
ncbi:hypothetical protein BDV12DRAFT_83792 [Aspergillus spectabilis]